MTKLTRADRFLEEMKRVVPWGELVAVVAPYYREAATGRKATDLTLLLRLHCLQLWYNLSDPGLEDAVHHALSMDVAEKGLVVDSCVVELEDGVLFFSSGSGSSSEKEGKGKMYPGHCHCGEIGFEVSFDISVVPMSSYMPSFSA